MTETVRTTAGRRDGAGSTRAVDRALPGPDEDSGNDDVAGVDPAVEPAGEHVSVPLLVDTLYGLILIARTRRHHVIDNRGAVKILAALRRLCEIESGPPVVLGIPPTSAAGRLPSSPVCQGHG